MENFLITHFHEFIDENKKSKLKKTFSPSENTIVTDCNDKKYKVLRGCQLVKVNEK